MDQELLLKMMISMDYKSMINFKNTNKNNNELYNTHKDYIYIRRILNESHCVQDSHDMYLHIIRGVPIRELCIKNEKYNVHCTLLHLGKTLELVKKDKTAIFDLVETVNKCWRSLPLNASESSLNKFREIVLQRFPRQNLQKAWELYRPRLEETIKILENLNNLKETLFKRNNELLISSGREINENLYKTISLEGLEKLILEQEQAQK